MLVNIYIITKIFKFSNLNFMTWFISVDFDSVFVPVQLCLITVDVYCNPTQFR